MARTVALVRRSFRVDGGAEHAISSFVSTYKSLSCKVMLICEDWRGDCQIFDDIVRISPRGLSRLARLRSFTEKVETWISENPEVIVQSHEWTAGAQILRLGDGLHSEWLHNQEHSVSYIEKLVRKLSRFHRYKVAQEKLCLSDQRTDILIVNSCFIQKSVERSYAGLEHKIVVVRNSCRQRSQLDAVSISLPDEQRYVLGFLGSGWARKGLRLVIEALSLLDPSCRLLIGGKDKHEKKYKALAKRLNVRDRVEWLGLVEDLPDFYSRIHCLVLPSRYDPFPNVITEAMTAGVPIVSSPFTGAVDYQHLRGVLIARADSPEDIAIQVGNMRNATFNDRASLKIAASEFCEDHVERQARVILDRMFGEDITY